MTTHDDHQRLWLLLSLGRYRDLEAFARECVARHPEWGVPYIYLGQALSTLGQVHEGIEPTKIGVGKCLHDPWAHTSLAFVLLRAGKHKSGRTAAEEALRLDPKFTQAYALLADAEQNLGEYRRCVQIARRGLAVDPTHEGLLSQLGWGLVRLGHTEEANEVAERGLEQHPNSASLHNLAGWVRHTQAILAKSRLPVYRRAEEHFAVAVRANPVEPAYRENRETNAMEARKHALQFVLLAAACVVFVQFGLTFVFCKIDSKCEVMIVPVVLQFGWLALTGLCVRQSRTAILSAPLARFGVPTIPLIPAERLLGRLVWAAIVLVDLALVTAFVGCGISALCRGS